MYNDIKKLKFKLVPRAFLSEGKALGTIEVD